MQAASIAGTPYGNDLLGKLNKKVTAGLTAPSARWPKKSSTRFAETGGNFMIARLDAPSAIPVT